MKSNKGITLTMLAIYIIVLTLVIGILASISNNFYSNTDYIMDNGKYLSEFNKFNMYFIEDVRKNSNIYSISNNEIIFADGTVYTYKESPDKAIYRNKVRICKNVESCDFTKTEEIVNSVNKIIVNVTMVLDAEQDLETSTNYVLKYW